MLCFRTPAKAEVAPTSFVLIAKYENQSYHLVKLPAVRALALADAESIRQMVGNAAVE